MASQDTTTRKRSARTTGKTATTNGARAARQNGATGNGGKSGGRAKPTSEMTLEELSLRAYKMTYERLHGSKKAKK